MTEKSDDIDWLVPFAIIVALEVMAARTVELAAAYSALALAAAAVLAFGWLLVWIFKAARRREEHPIAKLSGLLWASRSRLICAVIGIELAAFGISAFSTLKAQIPAAVPFYADEALVNFDAWLFGQDAWRWFDHYLGSIAYPVNVTYAYWLPTHLFSFTALVLSKPSSLKARAIIAFGLMWLFLGICLAYAFSSVGPIFYDRLHGGDRFADLISSVRPFYWVTETADYLWGRYINGEISFGGGISAMPSLHVAGSLWQALIIRRAAPQLAFLGWSYLVVIYLGSVMLGWHYATDGLVGMAGALLVWALAGELTGWRQGRILGRLADQSESGG